MSVASNLRRPKEAGARSLAFARWLTLLLAALSLTMESAHLLELPQKLQYSAELYAAVNTTMYRYFAIVGGVYQIGSIVAAWVLVYLLRGRGKAFAWTLAGALWPCRRLRAPAARARSAALVRGAGNRRYCSAIGDGRGGCLAT